MKGVSLPIGPPATVEVDQPEQGIFWVIGTIPGEDPEPLLVTRRFEQADAAAKILTWLLRATGAA